MVRYRGLLLLVVTVLLSMNARTQTKSTVTMEGVLLGTGFPAPDPNRAGPSAAIFVGDKVFIVDAGRGVTMRLAALRPRPSRIDAVFLTHLHSDHLSGLPDLFNTTWIMGRHAPLELYGPEGVSTVAAGIKQFYTADIHVRRDLTEGQPAAGAEFNVHDVHPGVIYDDGEVKVIAFLVDHAPVEPAFGYRFESHGRVIVFSGDYHPHDDLIPAMKGADVLVSEVYLPEFFDKRGDTRVAQRLKRYHCTPEQAGDLAKKASIKKVVFTHIIPPEKSDEIVRRAKAVFEGDVIAGQDLMKF